MNLEEEQDKQSFTKDYKIILMEAAKGFFFELISLVSLAMVKTHKMANYEHSLICCTTFLIFVESEINSKPIVNPFYIFCYCNQSQKKILSWKILLGYFTGCFACYYFLHSTFNELVEDRNLELIKLLSKNNWVLVRDFFLVPFSASFFLSTVKHIKSYQEKFFFVILTNFILFSLIFCCYYYFEKFNVLIFSPLSTIFYISLQNELKIEMFFVFISTVFPILIPKLIHKIIS